MKIRVTHECSQRVVHAMAESRTISQDTARKRLGEDIWTTMEEAGNDGRYAHFQCEGCGLYTRVELDD